MIKYSNEREEEIGVRRGCREKNEAWEGVGKYRDKNALQIEKRK